MKRIASCLVSALVLIAASPLGAAEEDGIRLTVLSSLERIGQDEELFGRQQAEIQAARNEWESFQVVVAAGGENVQVTKAEISDLTGTDGAKIDSDRIKLYREEYVRVRRPTRRAELPPGLYPDALVPFVNPITGEPIGPRRRIQEHWGGPTTVEGHEMHALPFEVFRGQNQPIWVDVHVPKDAAAGVYEGTFSVRARRGLSAEIPVKLTVWDFALPDGPTHKNHFGHFRNVARFFDVPRDSDKFREIEMQYCRAMAEHRLNPPLPHHLLPEVNSDGSLTIVPEHHEALKKYIADLHVTDFEIPRAPFARLRVSASDDDYAHIPPAEKEKAQKYYREYYEYLKENGWSDRAYAYLWDEPNLKENYEQVLVLGDLVHEAVPELNCLVVEQTYPHDPSWPDIDPAIDIWCPLWAFIDRKTILEKISHGDQVWSYTALVQPAPRYHPEYERLRDFDPPYWHIDRPLIVYRVPTWINRQYGITGLLYWSTVTTVLDPWNNPTFSHSGHFNGGGYLFYPGVPCGIDGPVSSMRLKNLRDGMEDYEYFVLLEQAAGKEAAKKLVDKIAPNWWDYCKQPDRLLEIRQEFAEQISQTRAKSD